MSANFSKLFVFFFLTSQLGLFASAEAKGVKLSYTTPEQAVWTPDNEMASESQMYGPEHFSFKSSEEIDLNIVPSDEDLSASLKKQGKDKFISDAMAGKNAVNRMFGVGESKVLDSKLTQGGDAQILEIHCQQTIADKKVETIEKYFIYPGKSMHVELRWRSSADSAKVEAAKKWFAAFPIKATEE